MKLPSGKIVNSNTKLTANFTWGEATKNCTRVPLNRKIEDNIVNAAISLQSIRNIWNQPIIVTSWYRTPVVNSAVGGARNSMHLRGHAIDFKVVGMSPRQVYLALNAAHYGGLGWYTGGWVHIDWRNWDGLASARWNR